MNDKTPTKTPEEMLIDLLWARYYTGEAARLLLLTPKGKYMVTWKDDTDLSQVDNGLDWKPSETEVTILKGRIAEGYIPVGVVGTSYDHPNRARFVPSGYLPDEETQRIFAAFEMGYITAVGMRLPREEKLLALLIKESPAVFRKVMSGLN
jgi:hypothetical protein